MGVIPPVRQNIRLAVGVSVAGVAMLASSRYFDVTSWRGNPPSPRLWWTSTFARLVHGERGRARLRTMANFVIVARRRKLKCDGHYEKLAIILSVLVVLGSWSCFLSWRRAQVTTISSSCRRAWTASGRRCKMSINAGPTSSRISSRPFPARPISRNPR